MKRPEPLILSIESSCDDSGAAVLRGREVLANVVYSQTVHETYGGVVPELASRAHSQTVVPTVLAAMSQAGVGFGDLDAVAATEGPGLLGSLLVGHGTAKALAQSLGLPFIGVHHIQAHVLAHSLLEPGVQDRALEGFPFLALVVSGGHTQLFDVRGPFDFRLLGGTLDDAVGEAFDKAATILGLGYPGGPLLDRRSSSGNADAVRFPMPRLTARSVRGTRHGTRDGGDGGPAEDPDARTLDFSFSGMKTALLYAVRGVPAVPGRAPPPPPAPLTEDRISDLSASFQKAAVAQVVDVLDRAIGQFAATGDPPVTLLVGGGVSANRHLRAELTRFGMSRGLEVRLPAMPYCLDNAAMIAALAHWRHASGERDPLTLAPRPQSTLGRE